MRTNPHQQPLAFVVPPARPGSVSAMLTPPAEYLQHADLTAMLTHVELENRMVAGVTAQPRAQYEDGHYRPEKIIFSDKSDLARFIARFVAKRIRDFNNDPRRTRRHFVLGLPTGATPAPFYRELVRLHRQGKVSFENVVTFNMDEYCDLPEDNKNSYHHYMQQNLFRHIDIRPENIHILNGNAPDLQEECAAFDSAIEEEGGVDLFIGGLGVNGHLAFNEPGTAFDERTHIAVLDQSTREANSCHFGGDLEKVPKRALTIGPATLLGARQIVILATGASKYKALTQVFDGEIGPGSPASMLRLHQQSTVLCDSGAAYGVED